MSNVKSRLPTPFSVELPSIMKIARQFTEPFAATTRASVSPIVAHTAEMARKFRAMNPLLKEPPAESPKCRDCDHFDNSTCARPIGKHFSAGFNGYRSRLHVGCATERSRERDLTKRQCCGPSARFFEPKGALAPMGGKQGTAIVDEAAAFARVADTVGDSDGDDGA